MACLTVESMLGDPRCIRAPSKSRMSPATPRAAQTLRWDQGMSSSSQRFKKVLQRRLELNVRVTVKNRWLPGKKTNAPSRIERTSESKIMTLYCGAFESRCQPPPEPIDERSGGTTLPITVAISQRGPIIPLVIPVIFSERPRHEGIEDSMLQTRKSSPHRRWSIFSIFSSRTRRSSITTSSSSCPTRTSPLSSSSRLNVACGLVLGIRSRNHLLQRRWNENQMISTNENLRIRSRKRLSKDPPPVRSKEPDSLHCRAAQAHT